MKMHLSSIKIGVKCILRILHYLAKCLTPYQKYKFRLN